MTMDVYLTDVGKAWLQDHYPQGIVWEYDIPMDWIAMWFYWSHISSKKS